MHSRNSEIRKPSPSPSHRSRQKLISAANPPRTKAAKTAPIARLDPHFLFSFSGIKTAVLRYVELHGLRAEAKARVSRVLANFRPPQTREEALALCPQPTLDLIASFQHAVIGDLMKKTFAAAESLGAARILVTGGVAANRELRARFTAEAARRGLHVAFPTLALSTDNAAMIAAAAWPRLAGTGFRLARPHGRPFARAQLTKKCLAKNVQRPGSRQAHGVLLFPIPCWLFPVLFRPSPHDQRGVDAAESKRIRQRNVERMLDRLVGHVVQTALGIGIFEIHGRRNLLVHQRQHGDACLKPARAAQQVAGHRFRAADLQLVAQCVLAKHPLDRQRLVAIARRRRRCMRVDVAHFFGANAGVFQRGSHAALRARALGCDARHVIRVGAHAVADHFGQNLRSARLRKLQLLQNQDARALADDKSVAILVEGAAGVGGIVVAR